MQGPAISNFAMASPATGQYVHTAIGSGTNFQGDFGYDSVLSQHDLDIYLFCATPRPGRSTWISVYYRNKGTTPVSGTIVLSYDSKLNFTSTFPANSGTHNANNNTITWTFTNLQPSNRRSFFRAWFTLPANVPLNTPIASIANIGPIVGDIDSTNNEYGCVRPVRNSWDPNDKLVEQGEGPDGWIDADQRLHYTVRFQNTGNDTAFQVVIKDVVDPNLDLSTFDVLGVSHPYTLRIDGNREMTWTFDNILLPDSNTNEPESHGSIHYAISTLPGLSPGTKVENTAAIYFDFNPPVITNTTVNTVRFPTGIHSPMIRRPFKAAPNPVQDRVRLIWDDPANRPTEARLLDARGRLVAARAFENNEIIWSMEDLPAGLYLLQVQSASGEAFTQKLVKE